ncbi:MAG TPA: PAS domain S-box protein [Mycobacteriales bacterium]|nr:PAS domain S-box protein [Mycobacteriales bacterium]
MTTPVEPAFAEEMAIAAIVRSSHDAVIAKAVDGTITFWNEGATTLYGFDREDILGKNIEVMIPPEYLAIERARHEHVARGEAESGYRCVRLHADGRPVAVVMSMSPVRDENGTVVGLATISRPVSDQETADARYSSLLEAAPDAMVCVDRRGEIQLVNAATAAMFGYTREELVGSPLEILLPESLRDVHRRHRDEFFRSPAPRAMGVGLALQGRHRNGTTFPVEVSLAVDSSAEGLAIAAVRDVSGLRATEAALRQSETQLRQLADNVDIVFCLYEIDPLRYIYVSPSFHDLTGWGPGEMLSDVDFSQRLVHPDDWERWSTTFFAPTMSGLPARSEHRIVRADGGIRWVRSYANPVPDLNGPVTRVVTTTEDVTDRVEAARALQEAEAAARAANDAKNDFLSRMSHELRTPLNAVLGFGQLLEHHLVATEYADYARHVVRAGRHLLDLINEVLDIARIEAGEMTLSLEPVAVASIVDETALLMQPLAADAGVTLAVRAGAADAYALADRQRLRQILLNLLSNAIKYNRAGGGVWVSWLPQSGGRVSIRVQDDGPGISPDCYDRIFIPFDRLGQEGSGIEGTGVGLTVTRGLTELMNGALTFDSQLGEGTTFSVDLPLAAAPPVATVAPDTTAPRDEFPVGTRSVLYIEDNEPNVRVMESVLALRPEWRMIHAGLASLGLELARAQRPDLILLDVHLPDGSGLDVLAALQDDPATANLRVVVLSADASSQQIHRLLNAGAEKYITKPLDLTEVLTLLDGIAGAKEKAVAQ